MRINQFIARCGICSRREAEKLVNYGEIFVNGKVLEDLAYKVRLKDSVKYQGKILAVETSSVVYVFNKPRGFLTTRSDELGRQTIYDLLPDKMANLITIGRLDMNSEGLLILTNDRELKQEYENPKNEIPRKYKVRVYGEVDERKLLKLKDGVVVDGIEYAGINATLTHKRTNSWIEMELREGKNREIRRVMEHLGYEVNRLIRTDYGKYSLGDLESGTIKRI
jgi:23S rRNA pseudouridine2605 synthase